MRAVLIILLALVAATTANAKPLPNACTLVCNAKLTSALGKKIEHAPHSSYGTKSCYWKTPYGVWPFRQVILVVEPLSREVFTNKWDRKIVGVRPVHGLGEMAYTVNNGASLVAWKNGIEVSVATFYLQAPLPTAILVAKLALAHL
jgi:hypothetical protein